MKPETMTAFANAILAAQAFNMTRPYSCQTDTECEAEEAARCWILCQR